MLSSVALAEDGGQWQFALTPYFMASAINATAGIGPIETDVDLNAGDVLEDIKGGFMMMAEAQRDRWVFAFDGSYFKLADGVSRSVAGPFGKVSATGAVELSSSQYIYQPMVGYRITDDQVIADAYLGARYTKLKTYAKLSTSSSGVVFPGGERSISANESWTDPVIGGRVNWPIDEKFSVVGMGDIGGFDVGSKLTWQLLATLRWQFVDNFAASAGYRMIYQDYEKDNFAWEVTYSGVILGVSYMY
jgi:hypothetical protein